jgi:hypothetical protein
MEESSLQTRLRLVRLGCAGCGGAVCGFFARGGSFGNSAQRLANVDEKKLKKVLERLHYFTE